MRSPASGFGPPNLGIVSPSSLIFIAVIAIWATYLVVHVARHREQLATARSVDRFSGQMRVLQRRTAREATRPDSIRVSSASMARTRPLRATATRLGGSAVVLDASPEVKAGLDTWGPVPAIDLMRRVKDEFDPTRVLAPGRFVGGL